MIDARKFQKRTRNMTLEKLLIFGFALAALFAVTTVGTSMMQERVDQESEVDGKFDDFRNAGG